MKDNRYAFLLLLFWRGRGGGGWGETKRVMFSVKMVKYLKFTEMQFAVYLRERKQENTS